MCRSTTERMRSEECLCFCRAKQKAAWLLLDTRALCPKTKARMCVLLRHSVSHPFSNPFRHSPFCLFPQHTRKRRSATGIRNRGRNPNDLGRGRTFRVNKNSSGGNCPAAPHFVQFLTAAFANLVTVDCNSFFFSLSLFFSSRYVFRFGSRTSARRSGEMRNRATRRRRICRRRRDGSTRSC
jgi:hypothetical protein